MSIMNQILGKSQPHSPDDYVEIDMEEGVAAAAADHHLHIAELDGQVAAMEVKDAFMDGDIIIADITRLNAKSGLGHIIDDLERLASETGGDIVQKGDHQLILTPPGISISREKLTA